MNIGAVSHAPDLNRVGLKGFRPRKEFLVPAFAGAAVETNQMPFGRAAFVHVFGGLLQPATE